MLQLARRRVHAIPIDEVADVVTYEKAVLPYAELFNQSGPERVVLMTCGGQFDPQTGWDSNVVVVMTPA